MPTHAQDPAAPPKLQPAPGSFEESRWNHACMSQAPREPDLVAFQVFKAGVALSPASKRNCTAVLAPSAPDRQPTLKRKRDGQKAESPDGTKCMQQIALLQPQTPEPSQPLPTLPLLQSQPSPQQLAAPRRFKLWSGCRRLRNASYFRRSSVGLVALPSALKLGSRATASLAALSTACDVALAVDVQASAETKKSDDILADALLEDCFLDEQDRPVIEDPLMDMSDTTPKVSSCVHQGTPSFAELPPAVVPAPASSSPRVLGVAEPKVAEPQDLNSSKASVVAPNVSAEEMRWSWYREHAKETCLAHRPSLEAFGGATAVQAATLQDASTGDAHLLDEYTPAAVPSAENAARRKKQEWFKRHYGDAGALRAAAEKAAAPSRRGRPLQRRSQSAGPCFKPLPKAAAAATSAPPWLHVGREPPDVDVLLSPLPL